jgi:hypothetical protein
LCLKFVIALTAAIKSNSSAELSNGPYTDDRFTPNRLDLWKRSLTSRRRHYGHDRAERAVNNNLAISNDTETGDHTEGSRFAIRVNQLAQVASDVAVHALAQGGIADDRDAVLPNDPRWFAASDKADYDAIRRMLDDFGG